MSILSTSKICLCIYTCKKDLSSLNKLKSTNWYKDISKMSNFNIIEVFADESIENEYKLENNILIVKTKESYNNLCIKTFKMIKACNELFDFDFLVKIDSNIIENRHAKTSFLFSFEYFLQKFYNEGVIGEYNGLTPIKNNTVQTFKNWAYSKNLLVFPEIIIKEFGKDKWPNDYWAGGCYCLSKNSIMKIIKQKQIFEKFKNFMGGCEDMCIAISLKL